MQHNVSICLSDDLLHALESHGVHAHDYRPAYDNESAGLDLYNAGPDITVPPFCNHRAGEREIATLIPTGLRVSLPENTVGRLRERGSILKTPFAIRAGVIDKNFTGEIFINLVNLTLKEHTIVSGACLPAQLIVTKCINQFVIVDKNVYATLTEHSRRRAGQLGSSSIDYPDGVYNIEGNE